MIILLFIPQNIQVRSIVASESSLQIQHQSNAVNIFDFLSPAEVSIQIDAIPTIHIIGNSRYNGFAEEDYIGYEHYIPP